MGLVNWKKEGQAAWTVVKVVVVLLLILVLLPIVWAVFNVKIGQGGTSSTGSGGSLASAVFTPPPPPPEPVPMYVSFRAAALDNSYVIQLRNDAGKLLRHVQLTVRNPGTGNSKTFSWEQWPPGSNLEIGWQEGWKFFPGDQVEITSDLYGPCRVNFKG